MRRGYFIKVVVASDTAWSFAARAEDMMKKLQKELPVIARFARFLAALKSSLQENGREKTALFAASHLVCFWHKADMGRPAWV